ncbi:MAG: hypothetical protein F4171_18245 [Gammaproteobacteria bacterium]|nr:hypothetical protein [Gammaproteobacteria bacterium]MYK27281.1 hypothetical protein [Gammaproteobacteria bacterium]
MPKFIVCALAALCTATALAETELAIIVAIPESFERTDRFFDVCEDTLARGYGCLAHGYDVIRVDLHVTKVLLGPIDKGRMTVEATDGYLRHNSRASEDNRHLFILRKQSEKVDRPPIYFVAEADPILGKACTVFPIEDYLSEAVWLSIETPFVPAEHCYTVREISQLIGNQAD